MTTTRLYLNQRRLFIQSKRDGYSNNNNNNNKLIKK